MKYFTLSMNDLIKNKTFYLLIIILVLFSVCLLYISSSQTVNLVFSDQIDLFYGYLFGDNDLIQLFMQQHGPHRQGVGSLLMYPIYKVNDWNLASITYLTVILLIMTAIIFFAVLYKLLNTYKLISISALLALLLSYGSVELITIVPNISHSVLPLLFLSLIAIFIAFDSFDNIKGEIGVLILIVLSLFTGFGIFTFLSYIVVVTVKYLGKIGKTHNKTFIEKYKLFFIYASLAFMIIEFFTNYSFSRAEGCISTALLNISDIVVYIGAVSSIPFGGSALAKMAIPIGLTIFFLELVLSIVSLYKVFRHDDRISFLALLLLLVSLGFIFNVALGRHCLGLDSAYASRYYLLSLPGIIASFIVLNNLGYEKSKYIIIILSILIFVTQFIYVFPNSKKLGEAFYGHKNNFLICKSKGNSVKECNSKFAIYPPNSQRLESLLNAIEKNEK